MNKTTTTEKHRTIIKSAINYLYYFFFILCYLFQRKLRRNNVRAIVSYGVYGFLFHSFCVPSKCLVCCFFLRIKMEKVKKNHDTVYSQLFDWCLTLNSFVWGFFVNLSDIYNVCPIQHSFDSHKLDNSNQTITQSALMINWLYELLLLLLLSYIGVYHL